MGILDGRGAVVTGAGRGIGRGHCIHLAENGASVIVNERIVVDFSESRRGIYRMIRVRYTDPKGFQYGLGFKLLDVVDDNGAEHPIKLTNEGPCKKIRIGHADVTHTGQVVYNIRYRLSDALRQFEDHDELYWNVTGTNWASWVYRYSTIRPRLARTCRIILASVISTAARFQP